MGQRYDGSVDSSREGGVVAGEHSPLSSPWGGGAMVNGTLGQEVTANSHPKNNKRELGRANCHWRGNAFGERESQTADDDRQSDQV